MRKHNQVHTLVHRIIRHTFDFWEN